ncbi:hypothetical protein RHMOL_Rhmol12G0061200 [Rhododendron molle]|uniref:Uncharacterized protein n=1 Tax=Rhododendron molle TaxID=49168 RepID=A0ACC0LF80_RHOML|nr:hypothetical protein RHMOL_Rhmol12G0061200 [Rhododendron molle]
MARTIRSKPSLTRYLSSPIPFLRRITTSRSLQTLAFEEVRSSSTDRPPDFTAFVLHGLLGSGRNWRSFARSLAPSLSNSSPSSDWRMVLVDMRNHGRSADIEGFSPPHDMVNAAKDLADLVNAQGWAWPDVVLGHSMGGKVALQFAESCARGDYGESAQLPKQLTYEKPGAGQLWVLDSVPGKVNPERNSDGEVEKVLQTLQTLPKSIPSRRWLVDHMIKLGFSKSLSEWIGSNLKNSEEHETWAFNLEGAVDMFNSYRETNYWPLLEHPPKGMDVSIVRAEKSDRWDTDVIQRLENLANRRVDESEGKFSVHVLPNSGHWVHVDNPKGLLEIVAPRIASLP